MRYHEQEERIILRPRSRSLNRAGPERSRDLVSHNILALFCKIVV